MLLTSPWLRRNRRSGRLQCYIEGRTAVPACARVLQLHQLPSRAVPLNSEDRLLQITLIFGRRSRPIYLRNLSRPKLVAAVNDVPPSGVAGKVIGFLDGGIPTPITTQDLPLKNAPSHTTIQDAPAAAFDLTRRLSFSRMRPAVRIRHQHLMRMTHPRWRHRRCRRPVARSTPPYPAGYKPTPTASAVHRIGELPAKDVGTPGIVRRIHSVFSNSPPGTPPLRVVPDRSSHSDTWLRTAPAGPPPTDDHVQLSASAGHTAPGCTRNFLWLQNMEPSRVPARASPGESGNRPRRDSWRQCPPARRPGCRGRPARPSPRHRPRAPPRQRRTCQHHRPGALADEENQLPWDGSDRVSGRRLLGRYAISQLRGARDTGQMAGSIQSVGQSAVGMGVMAALFKGRHIGRVCPVQAGAPVVLDRAGRASDGEPRQRTTDT